MANSKLQNTYYSVPDKYQKVLGLKEISYENLKKKKHIFDNLNLSSDDDKTKYDNMGGFSVKKWVEDTLKSKRGEIKKSSEIKREYTNSNNVFRKASNDLKKDMKLHRVNDLSKSRQKDDYLHESNDIELKKAALCIIYNDNKEFLLLLRSKDDTYLPSRWGYAGGGVDDGENPLEAVKREIQEETLMDVYDLKLFKEKLFDGTLCYIFTAKTDEEEPICNTEHDDFGWFKPDDIKKLKTVDGVYEDILEFVDA